MYFIQYLCAFFVRFCRHIEQKCFHLMPFTVWGGVEYAICRIEMLEFTFQTHPWVLQLLFKQRVHEFSQVFEDHTNPNRSL